MTDMAEQQRIDRRLTEELTAMDVRHVREMAQRTGELTAHVRMRAFEMVKPVALFKEDINAENIGHVLEIAERVAQWALHGPGED